MNEAKLRKLRGRLAELRGRAKSIRFSEMISFAEALERKQRPRSSPAIYESPLEGRRSVAIHYHPGCMKRGTAMGTLDVLEGDIEAWEALLSAPSTGVE